MKKIKLLLILILFSNFNIFSQTISFEYLNGIKPNSYVNISFCTLDIYNKNAVVNVEIDNKKTKTEISIEKYLEICEGFF